MLPQTSCDRTGNGEIERNVKVERNKSDESCDNYYESLSCQSPFCRWCFALGKDYEAENKADLRAGLSQEISQNT